MLLPAKAINWLNALAIVQHAVFHTGEASEVMASHMYDKFLTQNACMCINPHDPCRLLSLSFH